MDFSWILAIIKVTLVYSKNRRILHEFGWSIAKIRRSIVKLFVRAEVHILYTTTLLYSHCHFVCSFSFSKLSTSTWGLLSFLYTLHPPPLSPLPLQLPLYPATSIPASRLPYPRIPRLSTPSYHTLLHLSVIAF